MRVGIAAALLFGLGVASGGAGDPAAHATLDAKTDELEACFRGNVAAALGFHGVLTVRLTVATDGRVVASRLLRGTGLPRYRDLCVVERLLGLRLPRGTPSTLVHRFEWRHGMPMPTFDDAPADGGS